MKDYIFSGAFHFASKILLYFKNRLNFHISFDYINLTTSLIFTYIGTFLLSSWKTLLMVLSKDQPVSLSPGVCHKIIDSLIKSIRAQITSIEEINMRMMISLSETCLILMQRYTIWLPNISKKKD